MADKPDGVPSLEELGGGDELPNYWVESTTITVDRYVKQRLDEDRDGQPWNQYLESLRRAKADPLTISDVDQLIEYLETELYTTSGDNQERLENIERLAKEAVESAQRAEKAAEELRGGR